ncbi:Lrp/AsnC family transcriptional regulator [Parahaliea mediterranea]|uniref:Lrp/AsnC family transcriptional regulator n=1 Tax=Parahaliea mediterranea TaxID=651086 RepID=A0A939DBN0_9GAMM|nr:Lrp/AsnC family transcriptional regulator [Parahaliea mediterranea]MBN7795283.1 Lrp/AsnC family transcriptional regulator [Parahaliea mediterranea]
MDRTDIRILERLQRDGRISNQALAEELGISPAACWRRVRGLEEAGVVDRYAALLNRRRLGLNLCAFVHVTLARHVQESKIPFEEAVLERPEVLECFATTGDADFILQVVTADIASFDAFLEEFLFSLPQISQVRSNIALRELKRDTALPLDYAMREGD